MADRRASVEIVAKTVEECIEQGLAELNLTRDQVDVEVVHAGRAGLLGLGAQDAVVLIAERADVRSEARTEPAADVLEVPEGEGALEEGHSLGIPSVSLSEEEAQAAEMARDLLQGIIDHMDIKGEVVLRSGAELADEGETPPFVLDVTGKDLGVLIGRQGETLQALQYLTRLMLSRRLERWEPVVVDVESYRERRRRSLHRLALRMAERVASSGRRVVLEAMPAYERRIVHLALRDHPEVMTKSVGDGDSRKVTIVPR